MTPAERALLLAVAKYVHPYVVKKFSGLAARSLDERIAAVEAEAAPDPMQASLDTFGKILHAAAHDPEPLTEAKSCETCDKQRYCSQDVSVNFCGPERLSWSTDCNGTGKKEKK